MTTFEAPISAAHSGSFAPARRQVEFLGREGDFWRLMARGAVLLALTLGIYRFWLTTDMRRFLWSNTEVLGHPLEYTGTARELLIGFLIAVALLVPLYGLLFFMAFYFEVLVDWAPILGFLALTVLGHYAVYRARRYRLTRTVYRGIRFHQTGSAWHYAACATLWWGIIILTAGLAYPLAQSRLERLKMRNTYLGNLQGRFEGNAGALFLRGFVMWLTVIGPFVTCLVLAASKIDWAELAQALGGAEEAGMALAMSSPEALYALQLAALAIAWALLAGMLLFPIFQTLLLRWWASGVRFGELSCESKLRVGQVYGAYLKFLGWSLLFSIAAGLLASVALAAIGFMLEAEGSVSREVGAAVAGLVVYVIVALGFSTIYQVKVSLALWRLTAESLALSNPAVLESVSSVGAPASPVGEGLADALNVGGF